jgi:ribonuclease T2
MNQRVVAALIVVVLAGAGLYLWLAPGGNVAPVTPPPVSESQPAEAPAPSEPSRPSTPTPAPAPAATADTKPGTAPAPPPVNEFFVLAVNWQPAFCETAPDKPECRTQTADRFDADHFTLHGLWPQGEYCGVYPAIQQADRDGDWSSLPPVPLSPALRARLNVAMPGTASHLDRHEWIKHGTCFDGDAETYFAASLALLDQLNASRVRKLFVEHIGVRLTQRQIRAAFGGKPGQRVRVACEDDGRRSIVTELTIGLWGRIDATPDLRALMLASRPTSGGCRSGLIDAVGLQ